MISFRRRDGAGGLGAQWRRLFAMMFSPPENAYHIVATGVGTRWFLADIAALASTDLPDVPESGMGVFPFRQDLSVAGAGVRGLRAAVGELSVVFDRVAAMPSRTGRAPRLIVLRVPGTLSGDCGRGLKRTSAGRSRLAYDRGPW